MNEELIYLCDLTHTSQGYAAELTPYPIACIKSWLFEYSKYPGRFQVEIFKDPQSFLDAFLEHKPAVVGFSNYMWNLDLTYTISKEIKSAYPETFIVFGGPNYPLEDHMREKWLKSHPAVDMYILGEGEEPFTGLMDAWHETGSLEGARRSGVEGCHTLIDGQFFKSNDVSPRINDLNLIPSPYLAGYLDSFLEEAPLNPLLETNRGCPFTCTFCVDGIKDRIKVYRSSLEKFEQELEYIAQRYTGKVLSLADTNFGMYVQDLDYSRVMAKTRKEYGYPWYLRTTTGKNHKERVLECAEILEGAITVSASVQSLDPEVMANVKRANISTEQLISVTKLSNAVDANSISEVILGMPGDTKEKHFKTVLDLANADMKFILQYTLMMLEGTEMATTVSREKWQPRPGYRIVPRCFGIYDFGGKEILSAEIEEVCIATPTMPFEEYLECRSFALTVGIFYGDRILFEMYRFLENFGIKPSDVLPILQERRSEFGPGLTELYRSFDEATREELWDNPEELERFAKSDPSIIRKYISGELGNNVLYRHRATAIIDLMEDIHEAAFGLAEELLKEKDPEAFEFYRPYLEELKVYSVLQKKDIYDVEMTHENSFNYGFKALAQGEFYGLPEKLEKPVSIRFYATDEQKAYLNDQLRIQGSDLNGKAKMLARIPVSKLQRTLTFDGERLAGADKEEVLFAIPATPTANEFS
jgi:radical SAM superfamily enzyme YgiQ (UPF0313 family)